MMLRPSATLTEEQVIEILGMLEKRVPYAKIAERYEVLIKSISRIASGETWRSVSVRYGAEHSRAHATMMPLPSKAEEFCDLCDTIVAVKQHFGFKMDQPLHWGWFEGWDGLHSVTSDGYIVWESKDLVAFAQKLVETKINDYPVFADRAEELPTFELEDLMTKGVGRSLIPTLTLGDVVKISNKQKELYIRAKYANIATQLRLDFREVPGSNFVYLTKNKPKSKNDPLPVVIACITSLR